MAKGPMKGRKSGKIMNFSQPVLGTSSKRSNKPSVGKIVTSSAGMVGSPMKGKPPKKGGKRVY